MAPEPTQESPSPPESQSAGASGRLLLGGVAVACVLGVGLGLWARPAQSERRVIPPAGAPQKAAPAVRSLQIVFDDRPAEIGAPLEVMTAQAGSAVAPPRAEPPPAEVAPIHPARAGLVKVQDVAPEPVRTLQPAVLPPPPAKALTAKAPPAKSKPVKAEKPAPKVQAAKAEKPKAKPRPAHVEVRKEEAARKPAAKLAKTDRPGKDKAEVRKASAEAKAESKSKPRIVRLLGKLKPKKAEAVKTELAVKAEKTKPRREKVHAERARPKAEKPVRQAVAKPQKAAAGKAGTKAASRCASADPGANAVCADRSLQAADRELARAYRQAEAAGAPPWRLQEQQRRWIAARAAAAREAPWAVRDVYQARIAELRDMTRNAQSVN